MIKQIETKLADIEGALVDVNQYLAYCKESHRNKVDGLLLPDGRFVISAVIRHYTNYEVQGHSLTAGWLLDKPHVEAMSELLLNGTIRLAYADDNAMALDMYKEPTKEQYAFIEMLNFEKPVQISINKKLITGHTEGVGNVKIIKGAANEFI